MDDFSSDPSACPVDSDEPAAARLRVVGIGAGAGGLDALQLLLEAMPEASGRAFIVCRTIESSPSGALADLLRSQAAMPVVHAADGMTLEANRVHLIPAGARMIVLKDRLVAFDEDEDGMAAAPLDLLLHSLAASAGPSASAVILSGGGRDGVRGAASIRQHGGTVVVQRPESADCAVLPAAVIEADLASAVVPPGAMPALIADAADTADPMAEAHQDEAALARITDLLEARFTIDLQAYRPSLLIRRVHRQARLSKAGTLLAFADLLAENEAELSRLHEELMIGVTAFFRNPEAFAVLEREVLPLLIEPMEPERPIRIWVPACASGEEAYSLAMLFLDGIERAGKTPHLEIIASDRHVRALKRARLGRYRKSRLASVPPALVQRYMQPHGDRLDVGPLLRRHVTFVDHDLLQSPPPDDIDLVSCRNLLIYLVEDSRSQVLRACADALKPDGFLFLGQSEQPGELADRFTAVCSTWRLYRRRSAPSDDVTLRKLAASKRSQSGEFLSPPNGDRTPDTAGPDLDAYLADDLDSVVTENQRMLESTIDTLLASNDVLRRRNRDLRAENQRLTSAHAALDDVATMIAHDLKTPLRTVEHMVGQLSAAAGEQDWRPAVEPWLHPMRHQLLGLDRLIDDLLTYARQGSIDSADLKRVDVGDLLRETLTLLGLPKGIKVRMRPPSLQVRTWRIPLACILRNLLGQAIARIGEERGGIEVEAKPGDGLLTIDIADDGRHAADGASGLGIAIVRQLLEGAGGQLTSRTASSGRGHEVRFTWPIQEEAPSDAGDPPPSAP